MKISLIIPAYNEEGSIGACVDAALKNSHGLFHEIIVIDNASKDRTRAIVEEKIAAGTPTTLRVVTEPQKGLTRARQRGLIEATGDLLAYTDADTLLPEGWAEEALDVFSKSEKTVCLSGPYRYHDGIAWKNAVMTALWYISAPITYRLVGYMVLGGNFIARKWALEKMGGFDKSIEFYGEDTDIARRLSKFGKVVFRMDFFIWSSGRRFEHEGLFATNFRYGMNFIWQVVFHKPFNMSYNDIRLKFSHKKHE
jgi:glycosyltransferase involved in cell wall biosynthesis